MTDPIALVLNKCLSFNFFSLQVDGKYVGQVGEVGDRTIGYYLYNIDNVTFKPMITIFKGDKHGGIKDIIRYMD